MRLAFHIFRKDIRRLWWETLVATGALAYLAHMDANRMDYLPGPMEGLMNLVVPAAWAFLIAMLVHQESLVGDRQFWLTRPYPRGSLLAAKLFFVLCFVHLPSFAFDIAVVQARGFNPLSHIPALLLKQVVLAAALTIPAIALAALTRNLAQFASAGLVSIVGAYYLMYDVAAHWIRIDALRETGATVVITSGAVAAIALQYSGRRVTWARVIATGMFTGAVLLASYVPRRYSMAASCRNGNPIAIQRSEHGRNPAQWSRYFDKETVTVALPISVSGVAATAFSTFTPLSFNIANDSGAQWSTPEIPLRRSELAAKQSIQPFVLIPERESVGWLVVRIDRKLFPAISTERVRVTGTLTGSVMLLGQGRESQLTLTDSNCLRWDGVQISWFRTCSAPIGTKC
jgi:hypothetical protein